MHYTVYLTYQLEKVVLCRQKKKKLEKVVRSEWRTQQENYVASQIHNINKFLCKCEKDNLKGYELDQINFFCGFIAALSYH